MRSSLAKRAYFGAWWVAGVWGVVVGCEEDTQPPALQPSTMLVLQTNMAVSKDFDQIEIRIMQDGQARFLQSFEVGKEKGEHRLPGSLAVIPGSSKSPVGICITATKLAMSDAAPAKLVSKMGLILTLGGGDKVTQDLSRSVSTDCPPLMTGTATAALRTESLGSGIGGGGSGGATHPSLHVLEETSMPVAGSIGRLDVLVDGACVDVDCGEGQTCVHGACSSVPVYANDKLPRFDPSDLPSSPLDSSAAPGCFDPADCFQGATRAKVDSACRFTIPGNGPVNVAAIRSDGRVGFCRADGECLLPLDEGRDFFVEDASSIRLDQSWCSVPTISGFLFSPSCPPKSFADALCIPSPSMLPPPPPPPPDGGRPDGGPRDGGMIPPPDAPSDAGHHPPPPDASDGGCSDIMADRENCGVCGHSCLGGECAGGVCQPVVLAHSKSTPWHLAIDAESVYWTDMAWGTVMKVALSGGTPTTLASNQAAPYGIAVDATYVYWTNNRFFNPDAGTQTAGVLRVDKAKTPSTPDTLITDGHGATEIAIDGMNIYFASAAAFGLRSARLSGGTDTQLAPAAVDVQSVAVHPASPFVYFSSNAGIERFPLPGTATEPTEEFVVSSTHKISGFTLDAAYVYWTDDQGDVSRAPLTPTGMDPLPPLASQQLNPAAIAVEGNVVFWTNADPSSGTVMSCPSSGCSGTPTTLASKQGKPTDIAVDSRAVYWTNSDSSEIMKVARPIQQ